MFLFNFSVSEKQSQTFLWHFLSYWVLTGKSKTWCISQKLYQILKCIDTVQLFYHFVTQFPLSESTMRSRDVKHWITIKYSCSSYVTNSQYIALFFCFCWIYWTHLYPQDNLSMFSKMLAVRRSFQRHWISSPGSEQAISYLIRLLVCLFCTLVHPPWAKCNCVHRNWRTAWL